MDEGAADTKTAEPRSPRKATAGAGLDGHPPALDVAMVRQEGAEILRGELFRDLDRLGLALEIEAADALERGDEAEALRIEDRRLGVRLAQRLVSGVYAQEVDPRLQRVHDVYERLTG